MNSMTGETPRLQDMRGFEQKEPRSWTIRDVGNWLKTVGYENYVQFFADNNIDGVALLDITLEDLFMLTKVYNHIFKLGDVIKFGKSHLSMLKKCKPINGTDATDGGYVDRAGSSILPRGTEVDHLVMTNPQNHQTRISESETFPIVNASTTTYEIAHLSTNGPYNQQLPKYGRTGNISQPVNDDEDDVISIPEIDNAGGNTLPLLNSAHSRQESGQKQEPSTLSMEMFGSENSAESVGTYVTQTKAKQVASSSVGENLTATTPQPGPTSAFQDAWNRSLARTPQTAALNTPPRNTPPPSVTSPAQGLQNVRRDLPPVLAGDYMFEYPPPTTRLPTMEYGRAYVGYVESPIDFTLLLDPDYDRAAKIGKFLNKIYNNDPYLRALPDGKIKPNIACVTKFSDDNEWYRAVIEKVDGNNVTVRFVDYGNTETVDRRQLMALKREKILNVGPLCIKCFLADIPKSYAFTTEQNDKFFDMVDPGKRPFLVKFEHRPAQLLPFPVRMIDTITNNSLNYRVRDMIGLPPLEATHSGYQYSGPLGFGRKETGQASGGGTVDIGRSTGMDDVDRDYLGGYSDYDEDGN